MTHVLTNETRTTAISISGTSVDGLRHLSQEEFRRFGVPMLSYLRRKTARDGSIAWVMHAADGSVLVEVEEPDAAIELADRNSLILVATQ